MCLALGALIGLKWYSNAFDCYLRSFDAHKECDLGDHTAHSGRILELAGLMKLLQTETQKRSTVLGTGAIGLLTSVTLTVFFVSDISQYPPRRITP